ncbi:hypothetical protein [Demequina litorisediminis]|uniref:Uncharacterized protein n=1 Tax=Demequina litorisediminis TaxID=1849022 RepID=A0ABQ6IJQ7_9MICO|nr:hypothetical protein [Demequina litorisediminis]GMA36952.1 hypothetical protein GCM10025876_31560 [Demequina litorisediminis]
MIIVEASTLRLARVRGACDLGEHGHRPVGGAVDGGLSTPHVFCVAQSLAEFDEAAGIGRGGAGLRGDETTFVPLAAAARETHLARLCARPGSLLGGNDGHHAIRVLAHRSDGDRECHQIVVGHGTDP